MSSSTDLKIKTPKISSISDDRGKLLFTIENCDKVFFIEKGKIVKEGKPKDIL